MNPLEEETKAYNGLHLDRREFLKFLTGTVTLGGASALFPLSTQAATGRSDRHGPLLPCRKFGRAPVEVTSLCVGGDHLQSAMDRAGAERLIETAISEGVRFFDNAESYGTGESETRLGMFLCPKFRDEIFLMTKSRARSANDARQHLEDSLKRLRTDRIDLWQIHSLENAQDVDQLIEAGVLDVFLDAKASGKVRFIGFTGHARYSAMLRMLQRLKEIGVEMDACQMPMNVVDPNYESFILNVLPELLSRGYAVLAMKTLAYGQFFGRRTSWKWNRPGVPGRLVGDCLSLSEALGFVWSLPITSLVSGTANAEELRINAEVCRSVPRFSKEERNQFIKRATEFAGPQMEFYKA